MIVSGTILKTALDKYQRHRKQKEGYKEGFTTNSCLLYTSDAADE